ncbi:MAG: lytic transglycosylase domain-containing protein [Clostridia bacterium]|nr:lytic transglycosylase domain-containing protein [Clostridia bacterium]
MSTHNPAPARHPRSAARRARQEPQAQEIRVDSSARQRMPATPEGIGMRSARFRPVQPANIHPGFTETAVNSAYRRPLQAQAPSKSSAKPFGAWEDTDTSTLYRAPMSRSLFGRQKPVFWIALAVLTIALFSVIVVIVADRWKETNLERAEARRLAQLAAEKAKYKLLYRDVIDQNAYEQGVDPALVAAVIYNESRFQPEAVSYLGARGLMQIMETTGPWIAGWLNETDTYTFDDMFVPEKNIRYGAWYLGYLAKEFDNDVIKIAAGYHAGQNRVKEWLRDPRYSGDGSTLQYLPEKGFEDTKQYIEGVLLAYEMYKKHHYAPPDLEDIGV